MNNLIFSDFQTPELKNDEILIEIKCAAVNPIDFFTVTGYHGQNGPPMNIYPFPHIPGSEFAGIVRKKGDKSPSDIREGDRVIVYNRTFDRTCKYCKSGYEMLCNNGGIIGVVTNGGFSEYIAVPYQNLIKIPDNLDWEIAASLPVAGLTAYNAIKESQLKPNDAVVIFGGSGNTGIFCSQLGKIIGAKTIAVSKKEWIKNYGVDHVLALDEDIKEKIKFITQGDMADVVINSLGEKTWKNGMDLVGKLGKIITFGVLTGGNLMTDGRRLYNNHITIKGITGGKLQDLKELIEMVVNHDIKIKTWKHFKLEDSKKALENVFEDTRDGRIIIKNY